MTRLQDLLHWTNDGDWVWHYCEGSVLVIIRIYYCIDDDAWKAVATQRECYEGMELFPCSTFEEMVASVESFLTRKYPSTRKLFYRSALERVSDGVL